MKCINNFLIITVCFCELFLFAVKGEKLPAEIQKCKSSDNDNCIGRAIEETLKRYPTGYPDMGLPNIAVYNLENIGVSRSNPNSPIQINFKFLNCTIYGLESLKILKASGYDKELNNVEMSMKMNGLRLKGFYEMTGKLLLLPLNGRGNGDIEFKDIKAFSKTKMEKFKRDGKTYFKIKKNRVLIEPKQMIVKLENVFNGNPVLSQTINEVINENWKDVWTELQEGINNAISSVVENIVNDIFQVLSLEDMYLD